MRFASLLLFLGCSSLTFAATYTNPLKPRAGADPFIVYTDGFYHLLTTASKGVIEMTRAKTLEGLKTGTVKQVWRDSTPSRCCGLWAPEIHKLDGTWYMYYTAGPRDSTQHRPHVLKGGTNPWDTYTYLDLLSPTWGIDGSIIHFPTHGRYFTWSCLPRPHAPRSATNAQSICIAPLTSPSTIGARSIISRPTADWERHGGPVNEAPSALYYAGNIYLAFSASSCGSKDYALGLLSWNGGDPMRGGSWVKSGPVFSRANGNLGTGHNAFFRSPDGTEVWNVFHAENQHPEGSCGGDRYTMAERVFFDDVTGRPIFKKAAPLGQEQKAPSGERE